MHRDARHVGDVIIITPHADRIDGDGAGELQDELLGAVARGHGRILLDLGGVAFIDSMGLAAILTALRAMGDGGDLRLCAPRPEVRSIIELARLHRVVPVFDTVAAALADFGLADPRYPS
jgi:anti-sigma B factor antagonist